MAISSPPRLCLDCGGPLSGKPTVSRCRACYDAQRPLKGVFAPGVVACSGCGMGIPAHRALCGVCAEEANPDPYQDWGLVALADRGVPAIGRRRRR